MTIQDIKKRYEIVGNCDMLNHALDVCLQVAPTDLSVLIIGESGVGKEVLPRVIHDNSPRRRERYFAINCGSIPEGTIDSELFGHEKGAFTSAIGESEGYFGIANKGTLFLDEVGELPLATQARLLRVLETGEYIRVGGQDVRKTDVRIVAATNVNMRKAISEGKFREDLYYRLNTIPVMMPPLRERGNDILSLFRLFSLRMMEKYRLPRLDLTDDAKRLLLKYKWPGNVRQLKNVTEQISVLSQERMVTAEMLMRYIPDDEETTAVVHQPHGKSADGHSYDSERQIIFQLLMELQAGMRQLNHDVMELQKQVVELGGKPVRHSQQYSLPSSPMSLPPAPHRHVDEGVFDADSEITEVSDGMFTPAEDDSSVEEIPSASPASYENLNVHDNEAEVIRKALEKHGGNRRKAAEELGMSDRTLYRRIKALCL